MHSGLNKAFYPESVAIIGASADEEVERSSGWLGRFQQSGYKGRLYPINPRATQILGLKAYPSILDVPEQVDYAVLGVRASLVPKLLRECVTKGVGVVHVFAGGFVESGKEEGRRLQQQVAEIIKGSNTRLIGPNCLSVYCPSSGLTFNLGFPAKSGPVGVVSQTGAALQRLVPVADSRGIHFSKVISYGNAVDVDSPELIDFLANDPETKCVWAYIEGVADGQAFLRSVVNCTQKKPVVILKGGLTEGGARAISSHTATLVGTKRVWQAFFKQTNAIPVETFDEALNQLTAILYFTPPAGRRVGIVGLGGGLSVVTTDICEREGLQVPPFSGETLEGLETLKGLADIGRGIKNPVEMGLAASGLFKDYAEGVRMVASDPNVDFLLIQLYPEGYVHHLVEGNLMAPALDVLVSTVKNLPKPVVTVIGLGHEIASVGLALEAHKRCRQAGFPVFSTPEDAAKAVSKLITYYERKGR
ncbi:MAG: CoA-binding protein [Chloroflexi bacterium]|nr:CoA-binding protein [Chloroflexota bacterium]